MRVLEQTEEPKMNPKGNITLQAGMERDLAAIQAKLETLDKEAEKICLVHPEEAVVIKQRTNMLREDWELLIAVLKEHDKKLEETSDLYCFLKVLKHFEAWLSQTGSDIAANQEQPRSLAEAEKLLSKHQQIRKEIAIILTCRLEAHQMWEKSQSLLSRSLSLAAPLATGTMDANDDKVNGVPESVELLIQQVHFATDKILKKVGRSRWQLG